MKRIFDNTVMLAQKNIGALGALALLLGAFTLMSWPLAPGSLATLATLASPEEGIPTPAEPPLSEFIQALMADCGGAKHSVAKRTILSQQIERAASKYLEGSDRHAFVALLCLETRMGSVPRATSHAGARGIAQMMVGTAKAEAVRCGFGEITPDDLYDNELNLHLAACHYAKLVSDLGPAIAPLAYNGGAASEAVKLAQKLIPGGHKETLGYGAVHSIILTRYLTEGKK